MGYLGLIVIVVIIFALPQWWVKKVFAQNQLERDDFPGTAGQFAEHVIEALELKGVSVTTSDHVSYFDPENKIVALNPQDYQGKSLTAITIAAHEIGHLIQFEEGNRWLFLRSQLVRLAKKMEKLGVLAFFLMPFGAFFTRSPLFVFMMAGIGFSGLLTNVLAHLVTLPMELDASFGKALPLLKSGEYISDEDEPKARQILWAAAFTYLASALSGLLNLAYWLRVLRR